MSVSVTQRIPCSGLREGVGFPRVKSGVNPTYEPSSVILFGALAYLVYNEWR